MRRLLLWSILLTAVLPFFICSHARAAEGKQARFAISMQLGDGFFKMIRKQLKESPGANSDETAMLDSVLVPGAFTIPSVTGVVYSSGTSMRMDMTLPGDQIATMLVDQKAGRLYLIDHSKKTAEYADLKDFASSQLGDGGMLVNPEMAALDWDTFVAQLDSKPKLRSRELGSRTISGVSCRGIEVSGTMGDLTDAQELAAVPDLPALIDPATAWKGTYWIADGLPVPVKFSSEMMGLNCVWQLLEVSSWDGSSAFLAVPPGYKTTQLDMSMFGGALSGGPNSGRDKAGSGSTRDV